MLRMVVFFLAVGLGCNRSGARAEPVVRFAEAAAEAFGSMAATIAAQGSGTPAGLARLIGVAWGGMQLSSTLLILGGALAYSRIGLGRLSGR